MRSYTAGRLLAVGSAVVLAACQDGVTAPPRNTSHAVISPTIGGCGTWQAERDRQSLGDGYQLPTVTVTATFPSGGLPWNLLQQMEFPLNSGAENAACLNSSFAQYTVDTVYKPAEPPLPTPDGVDPTLWGTLSPREQRALVKAAEEIMRTYPGWFSSVSSVIQRLLKQPIVGTKASARLRANDFQLGANEGELLAGGIYGCQLYRTFVADGSWILSNDETLQLVTDLVTAFAEAEFWYVPLRALQFGRNGAIGAAMAMQDGFATECGSLIFQSIPGGRINVTDPYSQPRPSNPGAGYAPSPPPPPPGSLPIGWWDQ